MRLVQSFVGWARDDMVKLNNRKPHDHDSRKSSDAPRAGKRPMATSSAPPEQPVDSSTETDDNAPQPAEFPASLTVVEAWEGIRDLWRYAFEAVVREVVTLFRRRNGALPPGPRLAGFMILALFVYERCRRRQERTPPPPPPPPREMRTPRRHSLPQDLLARNEPNLGLRSSAGAVAATLSSPSRSLFTAPGSPMRRVGPPPAGDIDPSLPSPAQARVAQARTEQARAPGMQGPMRQGRTGREAEGARGTWWRWRGWTRSAEPRSAGVGGVGGVGGERDGDARRPCRRRYLPWLALLWLVFSVLEVSSSSYPFRLLKFGVFGVQAEGRVYPAWLALCVLTDSAQTSILQTNQSRFFQSGTDSSWLLLGLISRCALKRART